MNSPTPEGAARERALDATLESIADRTPPDRTALAAAPALAVIAAVAEGFRTARFGEPGNDGAQRWGALELRETLGSGAFGEVFVAWDPALEREVALKLRHAESGVLRWLDEARALARVRHPNVVVVYGADLRDGRAGIWMERVHGRTLEARLTEEGVLPAAEVARIGLQLASALRAVHAAGLLHGDIKTENVMWDTSDAHESRAVLMDFGAVRETSGDGLLDTLAAAGTPLALAPEQFDGAPPSPATDVYALGVLLFRLLSRRWPVEGRTLEDLRAAHRAGRRLALGELRHDAPPALVAAIERACASEAPRRTPSAAQLCSELREFAAPARPWRRRIAAAAVVASLAAVGAIAVPRLGERQDPATFHARALPAAAGAAQAPAWSAHGTQVRAEFAWHAVGIGDLDGDGRSEVAVSEIGWRDSLRTPGRIVVHFGSPEGPEPAPRWSTRGAADGEGEGTFVVSAGDVNGDGHPDLLGSAIGARGPRGEFGAVRVWLGDGHSLGRTAAWTVRGPARDVSFGLVVAGSFDVDGDGCDDVLVGAHEDSLAAEGDGVLRLYKGSPGGLSNTPAWIVSGGQPHAGFGLALAGGDVNGDGCDDILAGASQWSGARAKCGRVSLWLGTRAGPARQAAWHYESDAEGARAGVSLALGDVNGDGLADAVVSEPWYSSPGMIECGRVLCFLGTRDGLRKRPAWSWTGPASRARVGTNRVLVTDLDGDACGEIVVGAYGYRTDAAAGEAGLVAVFAGSAAGPSAEPTWWATGPRARESFGISLGAAGDTRGDGRRGLLVGAPYAMGRGGPAGRVDLFLFPSRALTAPKR